MSEKLWSPSETAIEHAAITQLSQTISARTGQDHSPYADLHRWSIENPGEFWSQVWDDTEIIGDKGSHYYQAGADFISSKFFTDAKLNVAENLLSKGEADAIAIVSILENGQRSEITWQELRDLVAATAAALTHEGVVAGDRIVAWTPHVTEVIVYALAGLSLGAVVSTASPDFAPSAVLDRFAQIEPKILLAASSYSYAGKKFDCLERLNEIAAGLETVTKTVLIADTSENFSTFNQWIAPFKGATSSFAKLPFDHPGFVLFSSGTTGKPKCIIHSGAGILLKVAAEHHYQAGLTNMDRVFYFTTCGWMMWNWLTYVLATGATIVLYDGAPMYPTPSRLFDIAEAEKLTFLGVSAKFIDATKKEKLSPRTTHDLHNLRMIASTGSVLAPESFDFVYSDIKNDVHLMSMSGGTDICGCFLMGVPTLPVYRGELQGACLGMAVDVFTEQGESADIGEKGELVCTVPFPSKPLGFWNDTNDTKYRSAYYAGFPHVWTHGDFVAKTETGGFVLYGRSDATLNSKGVRIGTAEIYRVVETFPEILESMAVAQNWEADTRVVLFVTLKPGQSLTEDLRAAIKSALRTQASPRHVPEKILAAPELPRTKSNKLVELAVADVINGRQVRHRDALANPQALDWFDDLEELRS
jgi:acetoacetyl-CoA synthetase